MADHHKGIKMSVRLTTSVLTVVLFLGWLAQALD
jgi:hypothetical protein